jgi:hypothetical protein
VCWLVALLVCMPLLLSTLGFGVDTFTPSALDLLGGGEGGSGRDGGGDGGGGIGEGGGGAAVHTRSSIQ